MALEPNRLIAYNLLLARAHRGWTQTEAAEKLEPFLGIRWSNASFSQAERSWVGPRVREFTADEIVAFARAFDLPITWFFMPPDPFAFDSKAEYANLPVLDAHGRVPNRRREESRSADLSALKPSDVLWLLFGQGKEALVKRLSDTLAKIPEEQWDGLPGDVVDVVASVLAARVRAQLGDLAKRAESLRETARLFDQANKLIDASARKEAAKTRDIRKEGEADGPRSKARAMARLVRK